MALGCAINTSSTLAAEICSGAPRLQPRASCKPLTRLLSHAASCLLSQPLLAFPLTPPLCLARSYGLRLHPHRSAALCHRSGEDPLPAASRTRRWLQGHGPRGWLLRPRRHPAGLRLRRGCHHGAVRADGRGREARRLLRQVPSQRPRLPGWHALRVSQPSPAATGRLSRSIRVRQHARQRRDDHVLPDRDGGRFEEYQGDLRRAWHRHRLHRPR